MMLKDLRLAKAAAERVGATAPLGAHAEALYAAFAESGHGGEDFSAMLKRMRGAA
jgi:3-hydroxyisobutyrate dehydrogenase